MNIKGIIKPRIFFIKAIPADHWAYFSGGKAIMQAFTPKYSIVLTSGNKTLAMGTDKPYTKQGELYTRCLPGISSLRQKGVNDRLVPINTHAGDKKNACKHVQGSGRTKNFTHYRSKDPVISMRIIGCPERKSSQKK